MLDDGTSRKRSLSGRGFAYSVFLLGTTPRFGTTREGRHLPQCPTPAPTSVLGSVLAGDEPALHRRPARTCTLARGEPPQYLTCSGAK